MWQWHGGKQAINGECRARIHKLSTADIKDLQQQQSARQQKQPTGNRSGVRLGGVDRRGQQQMRRAVDRTDSRKVGEVRCWDMAQKDIASTRELEWGEKYIR